MNHKKFNNLNLFEGKFCLTVKVRRKSNGWVKLVTTIYGLNYRKPTLDSRLEIRNIKVCWVIP